MELHESMLHADIGENFAPLKCYHDNIVLQLG